MFFLVFLNKCGFVKTGVGKNQRKLRNSWFYLAISVSSKITMEFAHLKGVDELEKLGVHATQLE